MASVALSAKAVGSTVKLKVGGTARNFIVIHRSEERRVGKECP